jgi:hypothetical protein
LLRRAAPVFVFSLALLVPFAAALAKGELPISDAALFEYYGRAMAHGSRLYLDLWDNKLPSIYAANAVLQILFGGRYVLHALAEAAVAAASVALFAFVLRRNGVRGWAPAALVLALVLTVPPQSLDSVEGFALAAILLAYALWFANRTVAAGIALALATTFWLPAILMLIPLLDRDRDARRRVTLVAATAGALAAYAAAMVVAFGAPAVAELVRSWGRYAAQSFGARPASAGRLGVLEPAAYALVTSGAGVLLAALAAVVRKPRSAAERFALVWTACALVAAVAQGNFFAHYFVPLLAPCVFAIAVFGAGDRATLRRAVFAAIALAFAWRTVAFEVRAVPGLRAEAHEKRLLAERVRELAGPGATIEVDPYEPAFFLAAGAVGEDRFGLVPPRVRPASRPGRAAPAVLMHLDAASEAAPDGSAVICERAYGWTIAVPRGAPAALAARCRALGNGAR